MKILPTDHPLIDANMNRFKEGARVLEDVARFILLDQALFLAIKALKHAVHIDPGDRQNTRDIGGSDFKEDQIRTSLIDLVNANALRMQEALRVLEEVCDREFFKSLRFSAYDIHAEILMKIKIYLKQDKLIGLYAICDPKKYPIPWMASIIQQSNITLCQIRMKETSKRSILNASLEMRSLLDPNKTCLIINDHIDIALTCADGVHLGQDDFPFERIREIVPLDFIVGITCHSVEEALTAKAAGANYISVGCLYPTQTKMNTIPLTFETLKEITQAVDIPVSVIGGIQPQNLVSCKDLGVSMFAVQSALWDSSDPLKTMHDFYQLLNSINV